MDQEIQRPTPQQEGPQEEPLKKTRRHRVWEWTRFGEKGLWDWLQLLIVPAVLAIGGVLFTQAQNERQQIAEEQRAQATAVQSYFDELGSLLLDKDLRNSQDGDEVRFLAQVRTLTILETLAPPDAAIAQESIDASVNDPLNPKHRQSTDYRNSILRFLYEADLINKDDPIVNLDRANLRALPFTGTSLQLNSADLRGASLSRAALLYAELQNANLSTTQLGGANLRGADLTNADLSRATLMRADLSSFSSGRPTVLRNADLHRANLRDANLAGADLSGADLSGTIEITQEQLELAVGDATTKLPEGLYPPTSWTQGDGQTEGEE